MLSEQTLTHLSSLTYRPDAKRQVCILPLGSIYWDDELPHMGKFAAFPELDRNEILRVFALRLKFWDRQVLSDEDRQFWESIRSLAPNWAIFRRLELSDTDRLEREEIERACAKEFEEFLASADEVSVGEPMNGMQSFSATFKLNKDEDGPPENESWWKRVSAKLKRFTIR
jgi:hypothetical protein